MNLITGAGAITPSYPKKTRDAPLQVSSISFHEQLSDIAHREVVDNGPLSGSITKAAKNVKVHHRRL